MGEVIVVTSGKGGVGKTTSTVNIAAALARLGKSVVVLDADIGLRNLDVIMGLENHIVYDLVDVVSGKCRLRQAMVKDKRFDSLYLLAASQTKDKNDVNEGQMKKLCEELAQDFDYVFVDCPAGIEQGFRNAVAGAQRAIVVTTPSRSAVRDADRILGKLESLNIKKIELLINKVRPALITRGDMPGVDEIIEILACDLIGVVPEDVEVIIFANRGELVSTEKRSRAGQAFCNIAHRITGEDIPLLNLEDDGSLKYKIRRLFGKKSNGAKSGVRLSEEKNKPDDDYGRKRE